MWSCRSSPAQRETGVDFPVWLIISPLEDVCMAGGPGWCGSDAETHLADLSGTSCVCLCVLGVSVRGMSGLPQACRHKRGFQKQEALKYELRSKERRGGGSGKGDGESEPSLARSRDGDQGTGAIWWAVPLTQPRWRHREA